MVGQQVRHPISMGAGAVFDGDALVGCLEKCRCLSGDGGEETCESESE